MTYENLSFCQPMRIRTQWKCLDNNTELGQRDLRTICNILVFKYMVVYVIVKLLQVFYRYRVPLVLETSTSGGWRLDGTDIRVSSDDWGEYVVADDDLEDF